MGGKYSITGIYLLSAISYEVTGINISENMKLIEPSGQSCAVPPKKAKKKTTEVKVHWPRYWLYLATVLPLKFITSWFLSERKANNQLDNRLIVSLWSWIFDQKKDITVSVRESYSRYFTRSPTQKSIKVKLTDSKAFSMLISTTPYFYFALQIQDLFLFFFLNYFERLMKHAYRVLSIYLTCPSSHVKEPFSMYGNSCFVFVQDNF